MKYLFRKTFLNIFLKFGTMYIKNNINRLKPKTYSKIKKQIGIKILLVET